MTLDERSTLESNASQLTPTDAERADEHVFALLASHARARPLVELWTTAAAAALNAGMLWWQHPSTLMARRRLRDRILVRHVGSSRSRRRLARRDGRVAWPRSLLARRARSHRSRRHRIGRVDAAELHGRGNRKLESLTGRRPRHQHLVARVGLVRGSDEGRYVFVRCRPTPAACR